MMDKPEWNGGWVSYGGKFFILGFLVSALTFKGCASVSTQPQVQVGPEQTLEVLHSLRNKETKILTAKGLFRASISGSGIPIAQNLNGVLFYHRPDSVQLKGFTRAGGLVFDFVRNQEFYQLNFPGNGRSVTGRIVEFTQSGDHNQLIRLSLRAMDAIFGKVNNMNPDDLTLYESESSFMLEVPFSQQEDVSFSEHLMMRVWLNRSELDVIRVEYIAENGEIAMTVECEDFRNAESRQSLDPSHIRLPFFVRAEDFRESGAVTLRFQELVANSD